VISPVCFADSAALKKAKAVKAAAKTPQELKNQVLKTPQRCTQGGKVGQINHLSAYFQKLLPDLKKGRWQVFGFKIDAPAHEKTHEHGHTYGPRTFINFVAFNGKLAVISKESAARGGRRTFTHTLK
jgi:hypothetical protein